LRYLLGDNVSYNSTTDTYTENGSQPHHSPILAWVGDGYPLYGPYGYSNATNNASGIRRMISGYVIRNGLYGTSNLTANGRTTIPQWAVRLYNVSSNQTGPNVSSSYPLGRYMEDNDYLGDQGYTQGVDFDLDEYNGRYCVTPEFPNGTYAYFVSVSSSGAPVFPYNIGRGYRGSPTGGNVTSISETVTTNFLGGTNMPCVLSAPKVKNGSVTLSWSAVEGGTYQVLTTTNFSGWSALATNISPNENLGGYTNVTAATKQFYRVARTSVATYDPVSGTTSTGGATITMSPSSGNRGTTISVTATISSSATPTVPPAVAGISSFTIGSLTVSNPTHASQYVITGSLTIPSGATTGGQTVTIQFQPPQGQTQGPAYTQANGFTVN
ncbi:MAG TPA: YHYH protein, partial [Verrucomicrobiae bacterium]|nr:YHYH protein [Verrucomicrobiae bacterium]